MAQTEVKPISQDELSAILSGNADSVLTPDTGTEKKVEEKVEQKKSGFKAPIDTEFSWSELEELSGKKEGEEEKEDGLESKTQKIVEIDDGSTTEKKVGRKPTDLISVVNDLVEAGELFGFEDGVPKTIEEARELIKLNIQESKNSTFKDVWDQKIHSYSPQVQAILHYAEQGGQDVTPLLSAIAEVERTNEFNIEEESGQEAILREYYRVQGWDDKDIAEEIETAKDLDKLKSKAEKLLPKINQVNQQKIEAMMAEQEEQRRVAEDARRNYLSIIKQTLDKDKLGDVKLTRQEKAGLWDGLTDTRYTSWSGQPTNLFFKKLEELQAGSKADYDHFLEIVFLTLNRGNFKDKIRTEVSTQETANTVRKLKIQDSKKASTQEGFEEEGAERKNTIKRSGFRNPFS